LNGLLGCLGIRLANRFRKLSPLLQQSSTVERGRLVLDQQPKLAGVLYALPLHRDREPTNPFIDQRPRSVPPVNKGRDAIRRYVDFRRLRIRPDTSFRIPLGVP